MLILVKESSVVAHYHNDQFQVEFTIQNNKNGYNYLLKYLNDLDHLQIIFESTGIYSRGMTRFCRINQINYIEMNPLEAKLVKLSLFFKDHGKPIKLMHSKLAQLAPTLKAMETLPMYESIFFELRERARFHLEIEMNKIGLNLKLLNSFIKLFLV